MAVELAYEKTNVKAGSDKPTESTIFCREWISQLSFVQGQLVYDLSFFQGHIRICQGAGNSLDRLCNGEWRGGCMVRFLPFPTHQIGHQPLPFWIICRSIGLRIHPIIPSNCLIRISFSAPCSSGEHVLVARRLSDDGVVEEWTNDSNQIHLNRLTMPDPDIILYFTFRSNLGFPRFARSTNRFAAVRSLLCSLLLTAVMGPFLTLQAQQLKKTTDDDDGKYTDVGTIALTISNFGTLGTRNRYWPNQPSCEYPKGSRIEHLYQAGLWVGARSKAGDEYRVTTAVTDRFGSTSGGVLTDPYEFTTELGSKIFVRSTLPDSRYYNENAVSHLDFVSEYTDRHTRNPATSDSIFNHKPLGINIHQESYAWNFPFAESFAIVSYTIKNITSDTLESVYIGMWANSVVRNTSYVRPGTTGYFDYGGNGFDSLARMMYTFEYQATPGSLPADSYIGISLLGTTPFPLGIDSLADLYSKTYYNAWRFRSSSGVQAYFSPDADYRMNDPYTSRYTRLSQSLPRNFITPLRTAPGNYTTLLSTGPFATLGPGDSITVVYAVVCAKKNGTDLEQFDRPEQRSNLYSQLKWAQQTYNGEDLDGNNRLDLGEDLNGDGILSRYVLPSPPRQPRTRAVVEHRNVVIYWDKTSAEESVDPVSKKKDFEGYRMYRSKPGADFLSNEDLLLSLSLVGEFDRSDDGVGYNTGFGRILLPSPKIFPGDTNRYWYRFPPENSGVTHLNGWQYVYGVAAFDAGDPANNLEGLESAKSILRVVPGTTPTSEPSAEVKVYPNPYYARAIWDGGSERTRKIYFTNLPARATITIYTVAGDIVAVLDHEAASYTGEDIEWFRTFGDRSQRTRFSGGEHAWDLMSMYDQAIATGLYLFAVKDKDTGTIKSGRFAVIK